MSERSFRPRPTHRLEWIRHQDRSLFRGAPPPRAGVAGAYLPRLRLEVPHLPQERLSWSVPHCAAMVSAYYERPLSPEWLAGLLGTDDFYGTPGGRLEWLRGWGLRAEAPKELQFFRDGTLDLDRRLGNGAARLVFRWEERWLRWISGALDAGLPPILFVDLGRLYRGWRGLGQAHAVVLCGGDGRQAWINDPARAAGRVRVGLASLMDALLPGEPLATVLRPCGLDADEPTETAEGRGA
jgi:hypothetical protein